MLTNERKALFVSVEKMTKGVLAPALAFVLTLVLALALAACDRDGNGTPADAETSAQLQDGGAGGTGGGTGSETGMELTDFTGKFLDALGTTSGRFEPALNQSDILLDRQLELASATMPVALIATYDLYDNALTEGMMTDGGGYREVSGDIITFGEDYVREENGFGTEQLAGDRMVVVGKVDLAADSFSYESYTERGGQLVSRTVTEGVILPDGSVILQSLEVGSAAVGMEPEGKAIFIVATAENLTVLRGRFAYEAGFDYNSIIGKGTLSAKDMAAGYELVWDISSDLEKARSTEY
jgi:hypothetical protein